MTSILLIGPDPETREILKLGLEVEGFSVLTALGDEDSAPLIERKKADAAVIDMIDYDEDEQNEVSEVIKKAGRMKISSVLLLPRGNPTARTSTTKACEFWGSSAEKSKVKADLVVRKPYELNALVAEIKKLVSSPKTSYSSRRDSRRRS